MNTKKEILAAFLFESKFIGVKGSKIHYMMKAKVKPCYSFTGTQQLVVYGAMLFHI
ncbi:MAG: hypothetical protein ACI8XX_000204 [Polaribacter sp.]|jgi:hypothetical protein